MFICAAPALAEHDGDIRGTTDIAKMITRAVHANFQTSLSSSNIGLYLTIMVPGVTSRAHSLYSSLIPKIVQVYRVIGCNDTLDIERWLATDPVMMRFVKRGNQLSRDGKHAYNPRDFMVGICSGCLLYSSPSPRDS